MLSEQSNQEIFHFSLSAIFFTFTHILHKKRRQSIRYIIGAAISQHCIFISSYPSLICIIEYTFCANCIFSYYIDLNNIGTIDHR